MRMLLACLAAFVAAAPAGASELRYVTHNGSEMVMVIGDVSEDVSPIEIYYGTPSEKMRNLVSAGTLFFKGSIGWETGIVEGKAQVYKRSCPAQEYYASGVFSGAGSARGNLQLHGVAPVFGQGRGNCSVGRYAFNRNSTLTFAPLVARGR